HQSVPASPSTALAAGLPDSALLALAVPASAQFTVGAAVPPAPAARAPPVPRAAPSSGRACATVPVAATTASGAASTTAQTAATTRGRRRPASIAASRGRPTASAAAHLVPGPGSLDLSTRFPFEPTRLWPQVEIFARAPTTGNRLPSRFQQKARPPE